MLNEGRVGLVSVAADVFSVVKVKDLLAADLLVLILKRFHRVGIVADGRDLLKNEAEFFRFFHSNDKCFVKIDCF